MINLSFLTTSYTSYAAIHMQLYNFSEQQSIFVFGGQNTEIRRENCKFCVSPCCRVEFSRSDTHFHYTINCWLRLKQRIHLSDMTDLQKPFHMVPFKRFFHGFFLRKKMYNTSHIWTALMIRHIVILCTSKKCKHSVTSKWGNMHLEWMGYSIPIYPIAYKWNASAGGASQETSTPQKHFASAQEN